jgi:hypothetical protein
MEWKTLYLPLALVLLALIVLAVKAGGRYPYRRKRWLFTKAEWHFFQALSQALNPQFLIMGKVRIADLLGVEGIKPSSSRWWKAFGRISSKHVDYVICNPRSGEILCAIELDDRSHQRKERRKRDHFVNRACEQAGLPLLRVKVQARYSRDALLMAVNNAVSEQGASKP